MIKQVQAIQDAQGNLCEITAAPTITAYKTSDEKLWSTLSLAKEHDQKLRFSEWYWAGNDLVIDAGMDYQATAGISEILPWLRKHRKSLLALLLEEI